jgi:hypothetical protein
MKIRVWAAALLLLPGAAAGAEDGVSRIGHREPSVLSAEDLAAETALASTLSPVGMSAHCGPEGWQQFRHGSLWSDYCNAGPCTTADCPPSDGQLVVSHPRRSPSAWPWRGWLQKPRCTCHRHLSALDLLRGLFGWKRRPVYYASCRDDTSCQAPIGHHPVDDPVPLPPDPEPDDEPAEAPGESHIDTDLLPHEPTPLAPAPSPEPPRDPDMPPTPADLPPLPADDPAPEPQPEIPHNKLPKPLSAKPASLESSRGVTGGRTSVAGRLSDYIHTR